MIPEMVAKRQPGRPSRQPKDGPGDYVGFRASHDLKARLTAAAAKSGRSLSTEAQFRLETSFIAELQQRIEQLEAELRVFRSVCVVAPQIVGATVPIVLPVCPQS